MKKTLLSLLLVFVIGYNYAQKTTAHDFTVTSTGGSTLHLFTTLNAGKTVVLEFFFSTCQYCQMYAPTIEQAYQNHGAGSGNVIFWGIDYNDYNGAVIGFQQQYGQTFPAASGIDGGANAVCTDYNQYLIDLSTMPKYAVICPNKTFYGYPDGVNYPPTANGFDSYITSCGGTSAVAEIENANNTSIRNIYPNPAVDNSYVQVQVNETSTVAIELYNILGKKIYTSSESNMSKGSHNVELSLSNIADGNYIVKLVQNNEVKDIKKLAIMR